METDLEQLEQHRVKVTVRVAPDEAKPVLDLAYRHIGESLKVPGFRAGKIPPKVVESKVGRGAIMQEFLEHAIAEFWTAALREHDLAPIGDPDFEDLDVSDVEGAGFAFSGSVDIRPRLAFEKDEYEGIEIARPPTSVSESEVDDQLDRLRDRFAELEVVEQSARRGDYAVIDVRATIHDEEVEEASGKDLLYEVGSGAVAQQLDDELDGKRKGDIVKFNGVLPPEAGDRAGEEVTYTVLVKEVKVKKLPEIDDDFAKTASELDTLEELRADIREKLAELKERQADAGIRDRTLDALIGLVDADLPEKLIEAETESRVRSTEQRAEQQGTSLAAVLQASGVDEARFRADARDHALRAIKADLALEAVARAEGMEVSRGELDEVVEGVSEDSGRSPKEILSMLEKTGQIGSLAGDIIRKKALDHVVEHAVVTGGDPPGEPASEGKDA